MNEAVEKGSLGLRKKSTAAIWVPAKSPGRKLSAISDRSRLRSGVEGDGGVTAGKAYRIPLRIGVDEGRDGLGY